MGADAKPNGAGVNRTPVLTVALWLYCQSKPFAAPEEQAGFEPAHQDFASFHLGPLSFRLRAHTTMPQLLQYTLYYKPNALSSTSIRAVIVGPILV